MQITRNTIDTVTQEEIVPSVEASFPYRMDRSDLNSYPGRLCPWHWHNDVEIFFMEDGAFTYHVPGRDRVFHEGDVGFINARYCTAPAPSEHRPLCSTSTSFCPRW